jgi:hypothetical protein
MDLLLTYDVKIEEMCVKIGRIVFLILRCRGVF